MGHRERRRRGGRSLPRPYVAAAVPRSIWNGALSFAGIDVPVKVFGAADPQGVQFRELHEPDGAEIAHELVDADGRKVDRRQVVKGFEVRSGEYCAGWPPSSSTDCRGGSGPAATAIASWNLVKRKAKGEE